MEDTKMLAFVGSPCHDLIIYLSGIIYNLGKNVLVIDNTNQQAVMKCISKPMDQTGLIQYKNIDYISLKVKENNQKTKEKSMRDDKKYKKEDDIELDKINHNIKKNSYNVILVINDKDLLDPSYFDSKYNAIYIITTLQKEPILHTSKVINTIDEPVHIIYRDVCDCKINAEFCFRTYVLDKEKIVNKYQIEFDQFDYEYRLCMEYEPYKEFKYLSNSYQTCLKEIIASLFQIPKKEINRAYNTSKKGL